MKITLIARARQVLHKLSDCINESFLWIVGYFSPLTFQCRRSSNLRPKGESQDLNKISLVESVTTERLRLALEKTLEVNFLLTGKENPIRLARLSHTNFITQ